MNLALRSSAAAAMRKSATSEWWKIPHFVSELKDKRVALPVELFYSMLTPIHPWFLTKKNADDKGSFLDRVEIEVELALAA